MFSYSYSMGSLVGRITNKFAKGRFSHHVAVLGGGTAVAQAFTLLFAPVLTRLYTPDDVGRMGLYLAFAGFAGVAASLRYEVAIVSATDDKEAGTLTVLSAVLLIPISLLASAALYFMIRKSVLGLGSLPPYTALLVFPALSLTALFSALRYWFIRKEGFGVISGAVVFQNATRSVSQVCFGWWGSGWLGLFWGDLLGRAMGIGRMLRGAWPVISRLVFPLRMKNMWTVARTYRKFPMYSLPSSLIDTLATTISLPLIVVLYGTKNAGFFALVQRVLAAPILLVGMSVADAFHSRAAKYSIAETHRAAPFFKRTAVALFLVGLGPAVLLVFFGERMFGAIFGSNWTLAGSLAAVMAPWALAQLVVSPLSRVAFVYQGQEWKLVYDTVNLICTLGALYYGHMRGFSLVRAVQILSWISVATYALYFLILVRIVNKGVREDSNVWDRGLRKL
jgi:lipopolysaccharide exporter